MKILAVDDDLYILELYKEILKKAGFELETAEDSMSGITKFTAFKPDLVILDVDMPAGGGKKFFERVRQTFLSKVTILFCTANPDSVAEEAKAPCCYLIKKPFTPELLLAAIDECVNGPKPPPPPPA